MASLPEEIGSTTQSRLNQENGPLVRANRGPMERTDWGSLPDFGIPCRPISADVRDQSALFSKLIHYQIVLRGAVSCVTNKKEAMKFQFLWSVYLLPRGKGGQTDSLPVKFAHKNRTVPMPKMTINEIG